MNFRVDGQRGAQDQSTVQRFGTKPRCAEASGRSWHCEGVIWLELKLRALKKV